MSDSGDSTTRRIDVHSHLCPIDLPDFASRFGDIDWPVVHHGDDGSLRIMRGGDTYRPIDDHYWRHEPRVEFLDRHGIDRQAVSPLPVLLPYWAPAKEASEVCRWQNEAVARFVGERPDRFVGLGTVALQDPAAATTGLDQIVELGLAGVEIGTTYAAMELGSAAFAAFFASAAERDIPILLHPLEGGGMGRMDDRVVRFSVGVMTDTSIAATTMLLAETLVRQPTLRLCLSHGGGSFFWILPRLRMMLEGIHGRQQASAMIDAMTGCWVDTASLGTENLHYLDGMLGIDRMVIGSDYPAAAAVDPCAATDAMGWADHPDINHANAERFFRSAGAS